MENMTVVAFYLISKESGNLFAKVTELIAFSETSTKFCGVFEGKNVVNLVENFTESLLCIKHLGARDSIAHGLTALCQNITHIPGKEYSELTKGMLEKILNGLKTNKFQFIFRRSAGLPAAVTSLMKAEPKGRRTQLLPLAMDTLFDMAQDDTLQDVSKIHSLNILKYVFQDA